MTLAAMTLAAMTLAAMTLVAMTLVDGLSAIGAATGIGRSSLVYASVSASHVLGISLVVGPIILADLAILGRLRALRPAAIQTLRRAARIGVAIAVVTGVLLLSTKPDDYLANRVFIAKITVLGIALVNATLFEWRMRSLRDGTASFLSDTVGRGQALASLVLWLTVLALGRWIAFV
ncbi:MAG: hypothetical protein K2Y05_03970 [Hyphomicrobiaceae bacterium]|nr:hypothetical protein [Hyphomicrobiaceae bacterium]